MVLGDPEAVHRSAADARVRSARFRHVSHNERTPGPWEPSTSTPSIRLVIGRSRTRPVAVSGHAQPPPKRSSGVDRGTPPGSLTVIPHAPNHTTLTGRPS
jgi:hypothetical protein